MDALGSRRTFASKLLLVDQIRVQTSLVSALASPMIKSLQTRAIDGDGETTKCRSNRVLATHAQIGRRGNARNLAQR